MWHPRWRQEGQEPDYRFSLANERTFLAWIRTALAFLAGGVALQQFASQYRSPALICALATGLTLLAMLLFGMAYWRWRDNEVAMRHAGKLQGNPSLPLTAAATVLISAAMVMLMVMP